MRHYYWLCRFPRFLCFQRRMLRHACALHALGLQEQDTLLHLSWHPRLKARRPLSDNIAVIPNFRRVNGMTATDMVETINAVYAKVADSNPFMLMTADDKRCEDIMLTVGLAPDPSNMPLSNDDRQLLATMIEPSIRRILLHAADEGVYKYVIDSALRFKLRLPALNIASLPRFKSHYRPVVPAAEEADTANVSERVETDETLTAVERAVCTVFLSTWRKYRNKSIRRADLVALYRLLRYTDYNEVLLCHALRRLRFTHRAARLLCIIGERFSLTEGFMFVPPLDDRRTRRLRRKLQLLGVQ